MHFPSTLLLALIPAAMAAPTPTKVTERQLLSGLTGALNPVTSAVGGTLTGVLNPVTSLVGGVAGTAGSAVGGVTGAAGGAGGAGGAGATGGSGGLLGGILKEREEPTKVENRQLLSGLTSALDPVTSLVGGVAGTAGSVVRGVTGAVGGAGGAGTAGASGGLLGGILKE